MPSCLSQFCAAVLSETQVQCPGVRVTVIDDLEGRDMPLLRAEVGSLDMTHESGPGMARYFYIVFTLRDLFC